jgi:hypothetical protein
MLDVRKVTNVSVKQTGTSHLNYTYRTVTQDDCRTAMAAIVSHNPLRVRAIKLYTVLRSVLNKYRNRSFSTPRQTKATEQIQVKLNTFDNVIKPSLYAKFGRDRL